MNENIRNGIIRLAGHLNLRGHNKIAEELEDIAEETAIVPEKDSPENLVQDLDLAYFAKDICEEINKILDDNGGDQPSAAEDLAYVDITSSEYTMLEEMITGMVLDTFGSELSSEDAEDAMHKLIARYDFIENLHEDSFEDLCEMIEEDIEELE